jgi:hypothetical protein
MFKRRLAAPLSFRDVRSGEHVEGVSHRRWELHLAQRGQLPGYCSNARNDSAEPHSPPDNTRLKSGRKFGRWENQLPFKVRNGPDFIPCVRIHPMFVR